jgi:hypothetical protein
LSVLAFYSALIPACTGKARQVAGAGTSEFRERCSRSAFDEIYAASAPDLKNSGTKDDFLKLMNSVQKKLGAWQSSSPMGWNVMAGTKGTRVTLGFQSTFEKGAAQEEFVWAVHGDKAALVGYHINSPAFLAE